MNHTNIKLVNNISGVTCDSVFDINAAARSATSSYQSYTVHTAIIMTVYNGDRQTVNTAVDGQPQMLNECQVDCITTLFSLCIVSSLDYINQVLLSKVTCTLFFRTPTWGINLLFGVFSTLWLSELQPMTGQ